ncbi:hypothetical protein GpartN1_g5224.t1 [Galdieria partita]|uniref:Importin N-terminal domain-containing protein n=1 Tax=Galdieria partita TaxID=83374 RepID=A0A9C7US55_9RHOD|nr:hypothetical protein GpartN1_g5224.t1 [Galdieria partita]
MDRDTLERILQGTFSAESDVRKYSEKFIEEHKYSNGFLSYLLQVLQEETVSLEVKLAAAVQVKNLIKSSWKREDLCIPLQDQQYALEHWVYLTCQLPSKLQAPLAEAFQRLVREEFPQRWPNLVQSLVYEIGNSQSVNQLHGALLLCRILLKSYEYYSTGEDQAQQETYLNNIVSTLFPTMEQVVQKLLENPEREDFQELLKLVSKIFWSATNVTIPEYLRSISVFSKWQHFLLHLFGLSLPNANMDDPQLVYWKTKKWIGHIFLRFIQRYGDTAEVKDEAMVIFVSQFSESFSLPIIETTIRLLEWPSKGLCLVERIANLCISILESATTQQKLWKLLKPHMKQILQSIIYPYLCFTDKDWEQWRQDPQEYIRDSFDLVQEYFSARSAACAFLNTVACDKSFKVLEPLWNLCMEILQQYSTLPNTYETKEPLARKKYGVIMAMGNMKRKLCGSSKWRQQLKEVLCNYIILEFQSPFMFLRAATCWLFGELASEDEFPLDSLSLEWLKSYVHCLTDQDVVVRVRSIVGLQRLVEQDAIVDCLRPYVGHILQTIFQLFGQVDQSELLDTLECFIEKYSQDLVPYAAEICEKLRDAFLFYVRRIEEEKNGEEEEELSLTIIGCLNGIDSILETVEDEPDKLEAISHILFPIFQGMFHEGREEYLDETFMIIESIFIYSKTVSAYFWSFYPLLFTCMEIHSGSSNFLDSIASLLECYVRYGTKEFLTGMSSDGIPYQNRMKSFVQFLLDKVDKIDHEAGLELLGTLLRSCKDSLTEHLLFYLDVFIHSLRKSASQESAVLNNMGALENTVLSSFFYNDSRIVFELLEKGRMLEQVIQRWIESTRDLDTKRETKIFVLGASELMAKVASQRFAEYSSLFTLVGTRLVQILSDSLLKAEQSAASRSQLKGLPFPKAYVEEEDDKATESDEEVDNKVFSVIESSRGGSLDNASIQDLISNSFDSEDWEDSSEDSDTLESVDEFEYFTQVFQWLNTVQPQVWLSCANSSTVDMQSLLQKLEQQRKVKVANPS